MPTSPRREPDISRPTEGGSHEQHVAAGTKSGQVRRERGRPLGSKGKPKGLIPKELAAEFLGVVKGILPEQHFKEIEGAIRQGKAISTIGEAKIMLALMGPPIWQRLLSEAIPKKRQVNPEIEEELGVIEDESPQFSKDTNERLKVWKDLLSLIFQMEKQDDEGTPSREKPVVEIFARSGVRGDRIKILAGYSSDSVGGDTDQLGGEADSIRALPSEIPERPLSLPGSEQEPTGGDVANDIDRDDPFRID